MINKIKKYIPLGVKRRVKFFFRGIKGYYINHKIIKEKKKIFCIGRNKTGTTSFKKAMEDLGYIVGNQRRAEYLLKEYREGNFKPIIKYCRTAQVFQDFPFSMPETYQHLDKAFPGSKFILTVRDSPEQWYNSVVKFHSILWGKGKIPTKNDLQEATYIWKGRPWETNRLNQTPDDDPYNKEIMINNYKKHNQDVTNYFKDRPDDLLMINLSHKDSYQKLINFLGVESPYNEFPWENKTEDVEKRVQHLIKIHDQFH